MSKGFLPHFQLEAFKEPGLILYFALPLLSDGINTGDETLVNLGA